MTDEQRAELLALAERVRTLEAAGWELLSLCERAGVADNLFAELIPDARNRSGRLVDETAKEARRVMNAMRQELRARAAS